MTYQYHDETIITELPEDTVFVFGSNLAGIHGAGSALHAKRYYGAVQGEGIGRHGNSYAIPTKDKNLRVLPLDQIEQYVYQFIQYAYSNPHLVFEVTRIGCGLAGYKDHQIAPFFSTAPENCLLPELWYG